MARPGITKQEVFAAANQLLGEGKPPTIELIRQLLKTGSNSTIAGHLRDWRATQGETQTVAINEGLPHDIVSIVKGLWDRLSAQAGLKVDEIEENALQTISELQQELQKYKTNNRRWQQLFMQWQQEKERLLSDKLMLEQGIESLQNKCKSMADQVQEKRTRIEELHRLHAQVQTNLETFQMTMREQRAIEQRQFEEQKQELQMEIKNLRSESTIIRDKLNNAQQDNQALRQQYVVLEKNHEQMTIKLKKQEDKIAVLEKEKIEFEQTSLLNQQQFKEITKAMEVKTVQLAESQLEAKSFIKQLDDIKLNLKESQEQIKHLNQEKWQLAQEKAELEGRLKQIDHIAWQTA
jgi:chromosome segregation ATPase